jgi:hypothetical protein
MAAHLAGWLLVSHDTQAGVDYLGSGMGMRWGCCLAQWLGWQF